MTSTRDSNIDYSHDAYPDDIFFTPTADEAAATLEGDQPSSHDGLDHNHSGTDEASDLNDLPPQGPVVVGNFAVVSSLPAFGRLVKRTKKFSPTTEAEFDLFCEVSPLTKSKSNLMACIPDGENRRAHGPSLCCFS